jgi:hypothetical protein
MAKQVRLRRGSTTLHAAFTGASGEVTVDTTKNTAVVHDGSTAGGHPLFKEPLSVTETERDVLSPAEKDWIYNETIHRYQYFDGITWVTVGA